MPDSAPSTPAPRYTGQTSQQLPEARILPYLEIKKLYDIYFESYDMVFKLLTALGIFFWKYMFPHFGIYGGNFSSNVIIQSELNLKLCPEYPVLLWFVLAHDQAQSIKNWLKAPDCSTNFNNARDKKIEGTGLWILKHPEYIEWRNAGGLLQIQGKGVLSHQLECKIPRYWSTLQQDQVQQSYCKCVHSRCP